MDDEQANPAPGITRRKALGLGAAAGAVAASSLLRPDHRYASVPAGIAGVFRFDTWIAICIPRVFMDDTDADRAAIQDVINQVMLYPLDRYTAKRS